MLRTIDALPKCQKCGDRFDPDYELDQAKLCYHCFEDSLEAYEERKRERIAREQEY